MQNDGKTVFSSAKSSKRTDAPRVRRLERPPVLPHRRAAGVRVDETAVTLKLRPVARRRRLTLSSDLAAVIIAAAVSAGLWLATDRSDASSTEHAAASDPAIAEIATPSAAPEPEPVLASSARTQRLTLPDPIEHHTISSFDDVPDDEIIIFDDVVPDEEIIIFDEPEPPKMTRARARRIARRRTRRGNAARKKGDIRSAKRQFKAALDTLPSYAPAAAALAELHMKHHEYRAALRYAKRASRFAPRKADYMLLLGDAYFLTKRRKAARRVWSKAAASGSAKAKSRLRG